MYIPVTQSLIEVWGCVDICPKTAPIRHKGGSINFCHGPPLRLRSGVPRSLKAKWGYHTYTDVVASTFRKLRGARTTIMYYVYILRSDKDGSRYVGTTSDLKRRLKEHNSGNAAYSSTRAPLSLVWYSAFSEKERAYVFEKYLETKLFLRQRRRKLRFSNYPV